MVLKIGEFTMKTFINKTFLAIVATVLIAGTAFFASCEKEETANFSSINDDLQISDEASDKSNVSKYARLLGIKPELIVKVEHKDGTYHCKEHFENGKLVSREWWCEAPYDVACCVVVYVRIGLKNSDIDTSYNGFIAVRTGVDGNTESVILIFEDKIASSFKWIDGNYLYFENKFPMIDLNLMDGFDESNMVYIPAGTYELKQSEGFKYIEFPVSSLIFE